MRILVFQHVDVEHPGIFRTFWHEAGIAWDAVEVDAGELIPPLDPYDLLVVMGGPMDVWQEGEHPWLVAEKAAIRSWVHGLKRPYLGVCLGHQLLAEAIGGTIGPGTTEVGITPIALTAEGRADPLLKGLDEPLDTFQWHSAEASNLPAEAVVLAGNGACAIQALRYGAAYGLQFHVEITDQTIADWHAIPAYAASLREALGPDGLSRIETDTTQRLAAFNRTARTINDNLMRLVAAHLAPTP
ncbi:MAG: type 1 glutamine amidotransferase [Pseudomonadota bacterium]